MGTAKHMYLLPAGCPGLVNMCCLMRIIKHQNTYPKVSYFVNKICYTERKNSAPFLSLIIVAGGRDSISSVGEVRIPA